MNHITLEEEPKPAKKLTGKEVLIEWLKNRIGRTIAYHDFEKDIVEFGKKKEVFHNVGYYCRQWRLLKEEPQIQLNNSGLSLEEVTGGKYMKWEIKTYNKESPK